MIREVIARWRLRRYRTRLTANQRAHLLAAVQRAKRGAQ